MPLQLLRRHGCVVSAPCSNARFGWVGDEPAASSHVRYILCDLYEYPWLFGRGVAHSQGYLSMAFTTRSAKRRRKCLCLALRLYYESSSPEM